MASLVFGGALESIYVKARSAVVMFLRGEDCKKYYEATPNGVHYKKNGKEGDAFVEIGDQVDVIGGRLLSWIGKGFTRCVRAVGVKSDITPAQLEILAQDQKRRVEGIEDGKTATGVSSISMFNRVMLKIHKASIRYFPILRHSPRRDIQILSGQPGGLGTL